MLSLRSISRRDSRAGVSLAELLVVLVILVFLQNFRATLVPAVARWNPSATALVKG